MSGYEGVSIGEMGRVDIGDIFDPEGIWNTVTSFIQGSDPIANPNNSNQDPNQPAASPTKARVNVDDYLNLRDKPNGQPIGKLLPGQIVTYLGQRSDYWVFVQTAEGQTGWCAAKDPNGDKPYLIPLDVPWKPPAAATAAASPSPQDAAQGMGAKEWIVLAIVAIGTVGGVSYALSR